MMNRLDAVLEQLFMENRIAGMSVTVTDREKVVYSRAFGVDNAERPHIPADPAALYRAASITKVVTGIAAMRLAEQGVLSLDTPVRAYVPDLCLCDAVAWEQLTLRHLLSHTGGLPAEYTPDGSREESALEATLRTELGTLPLHSRPEDGKYCYSNWGIRLASFVMQSQTGKYYSQLAEELVLRPLGMALSTFDLRRAATYPLSLPHVEDEDGSLRPEHQIRENAARLATGGLYSNGADLCRLARCLLRGGVADSGERILSPESFAQMTRPHAENINANGDAYGLTMMLRRYGERFLQGHLGSAPPYALSMVTDPATGYGVVTLMNTKRNELRYGIPEALLRELESGV